jgi:hypothetical protein
MGKSRTTAVAIPIERIARCVYLIRGQKVMLNYDLAELYGVSTKVLNQAVKRNIERFPDDFMFQFSKEEMEDWRSQIVTSNPAAKMGLRRPPYAFTELGVAMLSTVLRSKQAVQVNIAIMRTFVRLREMLATNAELARKVGQHDRQIAILFEHVGKLLAPPKSKKHPIGFVPAADDEED